MRFAWRCALGGDVGVWMRGIRRHWLVERGTTESRSTKACTRSSSPSDRATPANHQRGHPRVAHAARSAIRRALTGVSPAMASMVVVAGVSVAWWTKPADAQSTPGESCDEAIALRQQFQCDVGATECPSGCTPVGGSCPCSCAEACTRVPTWVASGGPPPANVNAFIELSCAAWGSTQNLWECQPTMVGGSPTLECSCPQSEPPDDTIPCPYAVSTDAYRRCPS